MFEIDKFEFDGKMFQGMKSTIPGGPNLLLIKGEKGFVMCGYLSAEVAERVREAGNEEAGLLLERAQRFRGRAGELLQDEDRVGSLRQIKIAHDLLNEASELTR